MLEEHCRLVQSAHVFFQGIFCLQSRRIPRELLLSKGGKVRFQGEM